MKNQVIEKMVAKAKNGDRESLNLLMEVAEKRIKPYVWQMTFDKELSEDLTQDVLMKIAGGICRLERCDRFWGWVYNIAGNCVRDNFRRKKAVSTVRFSAMEGYQLDGVLMDRKGGAEEGMIVEEGAAEVFEAVERLKKNVREIFKMRCCEGMAYSEIGDAVGCSETSARVTFLRAKNRIRRDLGELAEAV